MKFEVGVDAEGPEEGGGDVVGGGGIAGGVGADPVAGADDRAGGHAAAGEKDGVTLRPVVTAVGAELLRVHDPGGAPELTHPDDQRLVEQAARGEVVDERGHGAIGVRKKAGPKLVEVVGVGVPAPRAFAADRLRVVDVDEPDSGLDQATGKEATLAVSVAAVLVAELRRLGREVERLLDAGGRQHGQRPVVEGVQPAGRVVPTEEVALAVDHPQQASAVVQAVEGEGRGEAQFGKAERRGVRVARDEEGVVLLAEKARRLAGGHAAVAEDVGVRDIRRHGWIGHGAEPGDRAAEGRVKLLGVAEPDVVERRLVAGEAVIGGRVVVLHPMMDRTDLRAAAQDLREAGEMLRQVQTRPARRDRLELAPDAVGGVGLHVKSVNM